MEIMYSIIALIMIVQTISTEFVIPKDDGKMNCLNVRKFFVKNKDCVGGGGWEMESCDSQQCPDDKMFRIEISTGKRLWDSGILKWTCWSPGSASCFTWTGEDLYYCQTDQQSVYTTKWSSSDGGSFSWGEIPFWPYWTQVQFRSHDGEPDPDYTGPTCSDYIHGFLKEKFFTEDLVAPDMWENGVTSVVITHFDDMDDSVFEDIYCNSYLMQNVDTDSGSSEKDDYCKKKCGFKMLWDVERQQFKMSEATCGGDSDTCEYDGVSDYSVLNANQYSQTTNYYFDSSGCGYGTTRWGGKLDFCSSGYNPQQYFHMVGYCLPFEGYCRSQIHHCTSMYGEIVTDPHITTFDGTKYNYQGIGNFIIVKSNVGSLLVTGNFVEMSNTNFGTVLGSWKIEYDELVIKLGRYNLDLNVEGNKIDTSVVKGKQCIGGTTPGPKKLKWALEFEAYEMLSVKWITISFSDGTIFESSSETTFGSKSLRICLGQELFGQTKGLLGKWDYVQKTDFMPFTQNLRNVTRSERDRIAIQFAESWRVFGSKRREISETTTFITPDLEKLYKTKNESFQNLVRTRCEKLKSLSEDFYYNCQYDLLVTELVDYSTILENYHVRRGKLDRLMERKPFLTDMKRGVGLISSSGKNNVYKVVGASTFDRGFCVVDAALIGDSHGGKKKVNGSLYVQFRSFCEDDKQAGIPIVKYEKADKTCCVGENEFIEKGSSPYQGCLFVKYTMKEVGRICHVRVDLRKKDVGSSSSSSVGVITNSFNITLVLDTNHHHGGGSGTGSGSGIGSDEYPPLKHNDDSSDTKSRNVAGTVVGIVMGTLCFCCCIVLCCCVILLVVFLVLCCPSTMIVWGVLQRKRKRKEMNTFISINNDEGIVKSVNNEEFQKLEEECAGEII